MANIMDSFLNSLNFDGFFFLWSLYWLIVKIRKMIDVIANGQDRRAKICKILVMSATAGEIWVGLLEVHLAVASMNSPPEAMQAPRMTCRLPSLLSTAEIGVDRRMEEMVARAIIFIGICFII